MLEIKHFSEDYGTKSNIVDDVNLVIEDGDIYGFIGHNGAGKTTTIKAIVGINEIKQGDIIINGTSMKNKPLECKRQLAYVPDNPDIYEYMKGIQYLNFIADIFSISKEEREEKISKYSKLFEIDERLNDQVSSYSHGMKQKLVIISALLHSPKLLVLDEPFVGLDPKASHDLKEIFKELCNEGCSIFFSTHVLEVAEKLCNKIAIIKQGKIICDGLTENIIGNNTLENVFLGLENE